MAKYYVAGGRINVTTTLSYTGISLVVPANSICIFTATQHYNNAAARALVVSTSNSGLRSENTVSILSIPNYNNSMTVAGIHAVGNGSDVPLYVWAQASSNAGNDVYVRYVIIKTLS